MDGKMIKIWDLMGLMDLRCLVQKKESWDRLGDGDFGRFWEDLTWKILGRFGRS